MELRFTKHSRAKLLAMGMVVLMAIFVVRLFYIQVVQHDLYTSLADSEQMRQYVLHAKRGEIYTMDGKTPQKLVMNETVYTVWADPSVVTDKQAVINAIQQVAGGNTRKDFSKYLDRTKTRYQVLATKVTRKQAEMLKEKKLAGLGFDAVSQRVYPEGQLASQVLGFVDAEGDGKYGFEQANDAELKGKNGVLKTVTDVRDVPLTVGDKNIKIPAKNGKNMVLTIDRNIQSQAEKALVDRLARTGATRASALVMDPRTGHVLAMANVPTYDPGNLSTLSDVALLNNSTISNPYEPASVIKTATLSTGIDKGIISPSSTYYNTDSITIDDARIQNATKGQTGTIDMQRVLSYSLNTGTVTVAQRLGGGSINKTARDTLYDYFHNKFRLGKKTGIELAGEQAGTVVSPDEEQGNAVRYANMTFGQGLDVTTLQVAAAFCSIVNGGIYYQPTIYAGAISDDGVFTPAPLKPAQQTLQASTSAAMRQMTYEARHAFKLAHPDTPGYYVGGKTGTAQTIQNGKYVFDQTIGTYVGYGSEIGGMPAYVVMVEVEAPHRNLQGAQDAGPIFTDISNWMLGYLKLTPKE